MRTVLHLATATRNRGLSQCRLLLPFTTDAAAPSSAAESEEAHITPVDENYRSFRRRGDQGRIISVSRKLGREVLNDGAINKGTAFPHSERERMHIRGLLPPAVSSLEMQAHRIWSVLKVETDPVKRWTILASLQDRNETLYYHVLQRHVTELAPVIYTPTVAYACQNYSTIFRQPRGMFFSSQDRGHMASMVHNWPGNDVEVVVVTDGSRVLGLGDLGVHGIAVVIGKVDLYVVGAGFYPTRTLPVVVDVGTDNDELLGSDLYLGLDRRRLKGRPYVHIMDEFMHAVRLRWPQAVIQFEDFETKHAEMLLERYRHTHCCFNDDIQGTSSVAVAAVYGALAVRGHPPEAIVSETFVIQGAGSAGLGVANALVRAMQKHGLSAAAAHERIWLLDSDGLLTSQRGNTAPSVRKFRRQVDVGSPLVDAPLERVVREAKPSALLGLTGAGRLWDDKVLTAMGESCERPMIGPLSNPTDRAECTAEAAAACTGNRAIFASGSPFPDVRGADGEVVMRCNQSNNFYIFPGVGLGAVAGKLKSISDQQFLVAAEVLAGLMSQEDLANGIIFPPLSKIRHISKEVAKAVIVQGLREGQIAAEMTELHAVRHLVDDDSADVSERAKLYEVLDRLVNDPDQCYRPVAYPSLVYRHVGVDE